MWFSKGCVGHANMNNIALKIEYVKSKSLILLQRVLQNANNVHTLNLRRTGKQNSFLDKFLLPYTDWY